MGLSYDLIAAAQDAAAILFWESRQMIKSAQMRARQRVWIKPFSRKAYTNLQSTHRQNKKAVAFYCNSLFYILLLILIFPVLNGSSDEISKKLLGLVGTGLELGVELYADEPGVLGYLNDLNKALVGRNTCYLQTALGKLLAECVVVFPAVTVTLVNKLFAVYFAALGVLSQDALYRPFR